MSSYVLTPEDIKLLANFAGALNFARQGISPPTERFNASIKWSHADEIAALVVRAQNEPVVPPLLLSPSCTPGATPRNQNFAPGTVYVVQAGGDGYASFSVSSGGMPLFASVRAEPSGPDLTATYAIGGTPPMWIATGQWFVMSLGPGATNQAGRFSIGTP